MKFFGCTVTARLHEFYAKYKYHYRQGAVDRHSEELSRIQAQLEPGSPNPWELSTNSPHMQITTSNQSVCLLSPYVVLLILFRRTTSGSRAMFSLDA